MKTVLTIAGSDPSGGAGIQADLKTMVAHGVYGMSVITAVTAQNTCGVYDVFDIPQRLVQSQMDAVFTDIFPDAVKIGMVSSAQIIQTIAGRLSIYRPKHVVVDPVLVSTSGRSLIGSDATTALTDLLFPFADVITPNIPEAERFCGFEICSKADMVRAASHLYDQFHKCILVKGGHMQAGSDDLLYQEGEAIWLKGERLDVKNTHGTGCTLSTAIAANLAKGQHMETAVRQAKQFVTKALSSGLDLGKGNGPLNHFAAC